MNCVFITPQIRETDDGAPTHRGQEADRGIEEGEGRATEMKLHLGVIEHGYPPPSPSKARGGLNPLGESSRDMVSVVVTLVTIIAK